MKDLVLLHGALGASTQFHPLREKLDGRFNIHIFNFSGHGGNTMPAEDFSIPLFAEELQHYLVHNQISKADIFGYSMGGYVALYLAKQHPYLVNRIITLATKFHWTEEIADREIKMLDAETIEEKLPSFASELKQRHLPNDWKTVLSKTKDMLIGMGKQNALELTDYKEISNKTLLLLGEKDRMVSAEETIDVCNALPNAEFKILAQTPHPVEQTDVDMLADTIEKFLIT